MKETNRKGLIIRYIVASSICAILTVIIMLSLKVWACETEKEVYRILVNSFFVPGVVMFGFGLLVMATNEGTFDMLKYGVYRMFSFLKRDVNNIKYVTFYDYKVAQRDKRSPFLYLVIVGLAFVAISLILLIFYYKAQ